MRKLNEKRIELSSPYPVKSDEIIDFIDRTNRLICKEIDNKTIQLYIYTKRRGEHDAFAEVEITFTGYILHGDEGYDYQGTSIKEFNNDLNEIILHYDLDVFPKKFGENTINKENLFESLLNEADDSSNPKRKTTYGKIDLPKSYFDDWTYSFDENKKIALFDKLLKE